VGIAGYPSDGDTTETLLEAAEQALRVAKNEGGHQVRVYRAHAGV
jgi:GGDEF domain-containing protein